MEDTMKQLILPILMVCTLATGFIQPLAAEGVFAQKRVFTVDHDDVINTKEKLGATDYAKFIFVIGKIAWNSPKGALAL